MRTCIGGVGEWEWYIFYCTAPLCVLCAFSWIQNWSIPHWVCCEFKSHIEPLCEQRIRWLRTTAIHLIGLSIIGMEIGVLMDDKASSGWGGFATDWWRNIRWWTKGCTMTVISISMSRLVTRAWDWKENRSGWMQRKRSKEISRSMKGCQSIWCTVSVHFCWCKYNV